MSSWALGDASDIFLITINCGKLLVDTWALLMLSREKKVQKSPLQFTRSFFMVLFWSRFFAFAEDDEVLLYMTGTSPRTVRSDLPNGWSSKGTQAQSGIIYRYGNDGWLNWPFRRHLPFAWDRRRNGNEITFSITCREGRNRPWGARERGQQGAIIAVKMRP